jgi:hypothetical protein
MRLAPEYLRKRRRLNPLWVGDIFVSDVLSK